MHFICFSKFYSLLYLLWIFIEHQPHCSGEINPDRNWYSRETSSTTNDYCGPQHISYYKPASYNKHQCYRNDRTTVKVPSKTFHYKEIVDNQSSIHSGIATSYKKHLPFITLGNECQCIFKIYHFLKVALWSHKTSRLISKSHISSWNWNRRNQLLHLKILYPVWFQQH